MALYEYSWLILLAPLFAFAVIVFGTRNWDLLRRDPQRSLRSVFQFPRAQEDLAPSHESSVAEHDVHGETHAEHESDVELIETTGPHGERLILENDEDPKVPQLTTGAKVSGYVAIGIMGLACLYSWVILLVSAG